MDLKRKPVLRAGMLSALFVAACGTGNDTRTLAERLQGNWICHRVYPDQGFTRTDDATLAVYRTTIQYSVNSAWECGPPDTCRAEPPDARGGYFEGVFTDVGDSLVLQDGNDTVSFRSVAESTFTFLVNGVAFPMRRN